MGSEVVVGVNGSRSSLRAASVAAVEAEARGARLRLVYVVPDLDGEPCRKTDAVLVSAVRVAQFSVSGTERRPLTAVLAAGAPLAVLLEQARDAALLVIGAGRSPTGVDSLVAQLCGLRTGPLLVVSTSAASRYYGTPHRRTGHVSFPAQPASVAARAAARPRDGVRSASGSC